MKLGQLGAAQSLSLIIGAPLASRMSSPCLALCGLRGELTGEPTRGAAIICKLSILGAAA